MRIARSKQDDHDDPDDQHDLHQALLITGVAAGAPRSWADVRGCSVDPDRACGMTVVQCEEYLLRRGGGR